VKKANEMSTNNTLAITVEEFLRDFTRELEEENAAIFAGAGLSADAGFVNWKQLLAPFAEDIGLNVERETDLVRLAQFHSNRHSNRSALNKTIFNEFAARARVTRSHEILASLPIRTYWTTNYDTCIEDALRQAGKLPDVKFEKDQLPNTLRNRDAVVYKMHGDHQHASKAVLTKQDYERYHLDRGEFLTALNGDLVSKTFLFIGFSFTDPNLEAVLSRLHATYGEHQRSHYCFVKEESARPEDKAGDLEYRRAWQEHFIRDLQRYSIRAVKIQEYSEVPAILEALAARYKRKTVFISGAAHEYGTFPQADALKYVFDLSSELIRDDYRVITGFGLGVGSSVVNGALHQVYKVLKRRLKDELVLRPFPQGPNAKAVWTDYRSDMLDMAGIAVYMFGNKFVEGQQGVHRSDGIVEEFDIALAKGVKVLPLGFTGYVARELYDRVAADFAKYYPRANQQFHDDFKLLGDASRSLQDQLRTTVSALRTLQTM
jgi:hypothetical protein